MSATRQAVRQLIAELRCDIILPLKYGDFFDQQGEIPARSGDNRRHPRFYFRTKVGINLFNLTCDRPEQFEQATYIKDLSRSGLAFVHNSRLEPGEIVRLLLPNGTIRNVSVLRSKQVSFDCFEVAGEFIKDASIRPNAAVRNGTPS